jgi:hypothetical protein
MNTFVEAFLVNSQTNKSVLIQNLIKRRNETHSSRTLVRLAELGSSYRLSEGSSGYFGVAPMYTLPGDRVAIIKGCSVPLIVRKVGERFKVLGCSYIYGLMDGDGSRLAVSDGVEVETFEIV